MHETLGKPPQKCTMKKWFSRPWKRLLRQTRVGTLAQSFLRFHIQVILFSPEILLRLLCQTTSFPWRMIICTPFSFHSSTPQPAIQILSFARNRAIANRSWFVPSEAWSWAGLRETAEASFQIRNELLDASLSSIGEVSSVLCWKQGVIGASWHMTRLGIGIADVCSIPGIFGGV